MTEDTYKGNCKDPSSLNLYVYCGNSPITFVDPSGHQRAAGYYTINGLYGWYADPDASEFGKSSDTYKIIDDCSNRWFATNDKAEREQLHGIADDARRLARVKTPYMYGQDKVMDTLHQNVQVMIDTMLFYNQLAMTGGPIGDPYLWYVQMTETKWDYKLNPDWQIPYDTFNGLDMSINNNRNWRPWIYFDGEIRGADKIGNINLGYIGTKMGFGDLLIKNFATMDKDDGPSVELGIRLANMGR